MTANNWTTPRQRTPRPPHQPSEALRSPLPPDPPTVMSNWRTRRPVAQKQHRMTVTAGVVSLLAALPLGAVFETWGWFTSTIFAVGMLCTIAFILRGLRAPNWAPPIVMVAALPCVLAVLFPSGYELFGLVPTPATLRHFGSLATTAMTEIHRYSSPAPARESFVFVATLGTAAVAILLDLLTVVLRRPAVAGLPMLAIYSIPVAARDGSVSIIPFVAAAGGFLWLLISDSTDRVRRFGRRFSGDGRDLDIWGASPLVTAGQRLGVMGIVLAIGIPLVVPGVSSGLLDRFAQGTSGNTNGGGLTGSDATVGLYATLSGSLNRDKPFDMLRVTTNDPDPYYLRFAVADQLTMAGFRNRTIADGTPVTQGLPPMTKPSGVATRTYQAKVEVINLKSPFLPLYQRPTKIEQIGKNWRYEPRTSVVYSAADDTRKKRYTFDFARTDYSAAALRAAPSINQKDDITRDLTTVPRVPEVEAVVAKRTSGKSSEYDQVMSIFNYFSPANGFSYTLKTDPGTSGNAMVDFLTNKRGYCVQYSAAMAWMVRQAGYPARVAFGFSRGTALSGSAVTLTNFNLHAWTEVYFSGYGWIPFDPTPASGVPGSVSAGWAPNPEAPGKSATSSAAPSQAASNAAQVSASAAAGASQPQSQQDSGAAQEDPRQRGSRWPIWLTLGTLATLALLATPGWRRWVRRRGRIQRAARCEASAAWDELLDTMLDLGIPIDPAETPRNTAQRLARLPVPALAGAGARTLGRAEEYARYARQPESTPDLVPALAAIRTALVAGKTRKVQLVAQVLPRSVLRRWRAAGVARANAATDLVRRAAERAKIRR